MASVDSRILVLNPSPVRARRLCRKLASAGVETWSGSDVRDALVLAASLQFALVMAEESCTADHPELWQQLGELSPELPVLVYSQGRQPARRSIRTGLLRGSNEVLLAVLLLLFQDGGAVKAHAA